MVVYLRLAIVLFFQSGYGEVWNKLVGGLELARQFRVSGGAGDAAPPAAVTEARQRLGWQGMAAAAGGGGRAVAGEEQVTAYVAGMRLIAIDGLRLDVPATAGTGAEFGDPATRSPWAVSAGPRGRAGRVRDPGRAGGVLPPWPPGSSRWPQAAARLSRGDLLRADRTFLSDGLLTDVLAAAAPRRGARKAQRPPGPVRPARRHVRCGWRTRRPPGGCAARARTPKRSPASRRASSSTR